MSHAYHEALPGYHESTIWYDGCPECEYRAEAGMIWELDHATAIRAWRDMLALKWSGGGGLDRNASVCDRKLLGLLYDQAVFLERNVGLNPYDVLESMQIRAARLEQLARATIDPTP